MRDHTDIEGTMDRFGDTVWRACLVYFRPGPDAEDAFQDTFYKFALSDKVFENDDHVKAWLIRVATNACKDMLKASGRNYVELDELAEARIASAGSSVSQASSSAIFPVSTSDESSRAVFEVMEAMRALDDPPRTPVYLALYEGYTAPEIAEMLEAPVNTVYSWVSRGKQQLKEALS